ncbi:hypothetical protein BCT56_19880 [Vibrio lentus]|uniref:Uncharacterized protein n=2 Tax=Vibrio lentus TaxID=136468 RepID=A0AB36XRD0_9VIBR|nr:hypothetical protein BCT99_11250 [Vibrio lentus]PML29980.1 hypothetical protein BCT79_04535 [Vibrio lentus]PMM29956.1 hypothetical protein BCT56_19880 [Vibrio lentus]
MLIKPLQTFLLNTLTLLRLIPSDVIHIKQLDRYPDITKRLDEYLQYLLTLRNPSPQQMRHLRERPKCLTS